MNIQRIFHGAIIVLSLASSLVFGEDILVRTPDGEEMTVEVQPEETFIDVIKRIKSQVNLTEENDGENQNALGIPNYRLDFLSVSDAVRGASKPRKYNENVSSADKSDVRYIITTLATSTWTTLLSEKSSLKKAGERVDHVHPLRFLMCVFTDDEMNGCVHSIRDRSKVWKEFFSGLSNTLEEEAGKDNMRPEFIRDFSKKVKVDLNLLLKPINDRRWKDFVDILLEQIPRTGNPDRYDL